MSSALQHEITPKVTPIVLSPPSPMRLDTVRTLFHDLRQPLAAIRLLAGARGGNVRRRFDGILEEAQWLSEMVEDVVGGAAHDLPGRVDVVDLVARCVNRAQSTATCHIGFFSADQPIAVASPVALSRAVSCVLDNAVRAAGPGGHVTVEVTGTDTQITIRVIDSGPGLGHVPPNNALGLTITRALVSACGGGFDLKPGPIGGVVARIVLPIVSYGAVAS
jgi:signal transduction histidine kinase